MTLREKIECMEAFERGEEIEVSYVKQEKWTDIYNPDWSWGAYNYRIKPKSKKTITIEKWLISYPTLKMIVEVTNIERFLLEFGGEKVKLLNIYEVKL